jgi:hypothetical protein
LNLFRHDKELVDLTRGYYQNLIDEIVRQMPSPTVKPEETAVPAVSPTSHASTEPGMINSPIIKEYLKRKAAKSERLRTAESHVAKHMKVGEETLGPSK